MSEQAAVEFVKLGHTLGMLWHFLKDADVIDVDHSYMRGAPLQETFERAPKYAPINMRTIETLISEAQAIARNLVRTPDITETLVTLQLLNNALVGVHQTAELLIHQNRNEMAVEQCRSAVDEAFDNYGVALERLSAKALVAGDDRLTADPIQAGDSEETHRAPDVPTKMLWLAKALLLVSTHPELPDAKIAKQVGRDPSALSRSKEYQAAAALARKQGSVRGGSVSIDPVTNDRTVEAAAEGMGQDEQEETDRRIDADIQKRNASRNAKRRKPQ